METYDIVTNKVGRRILRARDYIDIDANDNIAYEDFDIVFLDTPQLSYNTIRHMLGKTSPLISRKCRLKPRFMTVFNSSRLEKLEALIDGFAQSATDDTVTLRSEEILEQIKNLQIIPKDSEIDDERDFFRRLTQYCISRSLLDFTASTIPSLAKGLSAIYSAYVDIHETVGCGNNPDDTNLRRIVESCIEKGYIEPKQFVERIHLCPKCHSDSLLFSECCTKCKSSNLTSEDMIHHFRCANISPESEYLYDGKLRCPKCRHFLRHIGIDYDRPGKVHVCNNCGETQLHSEMKVTCAVCGLVTQPHLLIPYDIQEWTFTPKGKKELK